ncbi:MAG: TonB-dependent receptor plug domain-containing protein [Rhizomicrobium sp.]
MSLQTNSAKFAGVLLMTTAFTAPAFAQIETVVVTAERKAEDIQTVPVAVTALTGADLKSKQVNSFRDLQFHVPSVTYTKSNFGGAQFQIRGITTQFGLGAAIAQNQNDIYIEAPSLVNGQYFDVDRVEVARGPQSTSYGRAATGGAVNIITSKPNLDEFQARASFDYGSYNTMKPELMVNIPLIDGELGVRFAALGVWHDGYEKNIYSGPQIFPGSPVDKDINGQGTASGRGSIRWQPSEDTTIDITGEIGYENDTRVRGDKQECHRDPSGVLGCLPDQLAFDPINANSTVAVTLASKQGLTALINTGLPFPVNFPTSQFLGQTLGLYNLAGNGGAVNPAGPAPLNGLGSNAAGHIPADLLTVDTAYNPRTKGTNGTYTFNWAQTINSWLKSTVDFGYVNSRQFTQQAYEEGAPENISSLVAPAVGAFNAVFGPLATPYTAAYFNVPGALPLSNTYYNGTFGSYGGIIDNTRGGILTKTQYSGAYDEDNFAQHELTGEVRFQTSFEGPLNFSAGAFWMSYTSRNQYWVASPLLDYDAIMGGATIRYLNAAAGNPDIGPIVLADPTFDSESRRDDVQSRSVFLEGTYDILPDTLRVIAGARYNDDRTSLLRTTAAVGGALLTNGFAPIGSTSVGLTMIPVPGSLTGQGNSVTDKWTGRVTVNWTPKLSWTDQTLVYGTLSRGELAGGINVSNSPLTANIAPTIYQPATVDAAELGTKNTLLDGTLQANLDVWYYNYENYQVGIIANRQALTLNIPAHLYGAEGEFVWQPEDDLAFNLTLSLTRSQAGTAYIPDQRNPTAGVPNSILVKDLVNGSNCVIVPTSAASAGHTPGESTAFHVDNFYLPNGGNAAIDAPFGVPLVNYGLCAPGTATEAALKTAGFDYTLAVNPKTGVATTIHDGNGNAVNLKGNELPQVPNAQIGLGAQWTAHLWDAYTLVPRVDYYWQSSMQSRVWNDENIDTIHAWDTMNAQIQLNAPDDKWYARVFATNVFDKRNPTGQYLTDATSALYTNVFAEDPRVVGVSVGASW